MIKIEIKTDILNIYNDGIKLFYTKSDLGVKKFDIYDTSKPNNRYPYCSIFNIYTGNDVTLFNADTLDPDSDFYTSNFNDYIQIIADHIGGQFICLEELVYLSYELNDYYLTDKSGNDNDALLLSNCKYYDGTSTSNVTDTIIGLLDRITINYSDDGDDWGNTYDSDTDVNSGYWEIINDYTLQIGYDGTSYYTGWVGLVEGFDENGVKLFSFTMASGSDNQDVSAITKLNIIQDRYNLVYDDKNIILEL
jgi:hypothetical protein